MPKIPQYTSEADLRPTEVGVEATAAAARRGGAFFNQAAQDLKQLGSETANAGEQTARMAGSAIKGAGQVAVEYVDRQDKVKVSTAMTGGLATLEKDWQQTLNGNGLDKNDPNYVPPANPNDTTIAAKFQKDRVEPFLESLSQIPFGENGQKYAENKAAELRQHISQKMTADISTQAGNARVLNRITTVNNLGSLVATDPSFSTVDFAIKQLREEASHDLSNKNLTADQIGKLKIHDAADEQRLVHAAANAAISKSPDPEGAAREFIKRYPDLIKGDEANTFAKAAKAQLKANNYYDRQSAILEKQQADLAVHKAATELIASRVAVDPNDPSRLIVAPDFAKRALNIARDNPNAPSTATIVRTLLDWSESQQKKERVVHTDQAALNDILVGLSDPDKPKTKIDILQAALEEKLDPRATSLLLQKEQALREQPIKNPQFTNAMNGAKAILGDGEKGKANFAKFYQEFSTEVQRQERATGGLPAGSLSLSDENSLLRKTLKNYELLPHEKMLDHLTKNLGMGVTSSDEIIKLLNPNAASPAKPVELPPKDKLVKDQVYDTAQGKKKWTGTGFVNP